MDYTYSPAIQHFNLDAIDNNFPKEEYREGQKEAIEFILNSFNNGKKVVMLECPTGGGKSVTAMTIANMVNKSYYLTITKQLQDQLVNDFSDVVELKGRGSYPCTYWNKYGDQMVSRQLITAEELLERKRNYGNCANGFCRTKYNGVDRHRYKCMKCFAKDGPVSGGQLNNLSGDNRYSNCQYYEQVHRAMNGRKVVMNFSSFLYQTQMTKRFDLARDLLIVDECHQAEPQLLDFVSLRISDYHLQDHGIFIPELKSALEYAMWFEDSKMHVLIYNIIREANDSENNRLADDMGRLLKKYKMFMEQVKENEWICEYEEKTSGGKTHRSVVLKPVFATNFVQPLLFKHANRILMMSATIFDVNVMCKSLGLDKSHVAAYRMKNRFPKENRPIYLRTVDKMTGGKSEMHRWAPKLSKAVNDICNDYPDKKGIIHTHNFAIMDYILTHADKSTKSRLLNQRDFRNKHEMLEIHKKKPNSIIIAPAMHEGVDLKDDLSRFQILCKTPYPNFFDDKQLARRVELDYKYYLWLVALKVAQSVGRSVRSEDDYADTYILDESIYRFMDQAGKMLPSWFKEAIIDV